MSAHSNLLQGYLSTLTSDPGVYRFINAQGDILYVGKAANLKKRVTSYFKQQVGAKTRSMVSQIVGIEVSITRSETEALLLESTLIKSLRPKYNILMRDDKSYPFIHMVTSHSFPRLAVMRSKKKPIKGAFFGPYPSVTALRDTLNTLQDVFKLRNCSDPFFQARRRPCLQYEIKRCSAPCVGLITASQYQQTVRDAIRFLQGKSQHIVEDLVEQMEQAVSELRFEEAARLRDQVKRVRLVQEQQGMVRAAGEADLIIIEASPGFACIQYVSVRAGEVVSSQSFFPSVPQWMGSSEEVWSAVFTAFIAHHYVDHPERIPELIISNQVFSDLAITQSMLRSLRGQPCRIQINPRGVQARWLDFAENNLRLSVRQHQQSKETMAARFKALCALLERTEPLHEMVCFDVSHTQGTHTVASCVVFDEEGPLKRAYRRFNLSGFTPGDDYAAMEQALRRYFKNKTDRPQLLIVDGGQGQVTVARRVLDALSIQDVMLMGIAKGSARKAGQEHLLVSNSLGIRTFTLAPDDPALHLLQHIRDEAHRFAITAHRKKRQQKSVQSVLDPIEGIGPKRRQALLRRFGGLRELSVASLEELIKVPGISPILAARIHHHFHL